MPPTSEPRPAFLVEPRLAPIVAAATVGGLGAGVLPLLMDAFVSDPDLGLDASLAGSLLTAELLATFVASTAAARRMARDSRRAWGVAGAGVAMLGNALTAFADGYAPLLATRSLTGLGAGAALAAAMAAAAASREPDRLFATVALIDGLLVACVLAALPWLIEPYGAPGAFGGIAALCGVALPFAWGLPRAPAAAASRAAGAGAHRQAALATLAAVLALSVSGYAIWTLSAQFGERSGLGPAAIGTWLGVSGVVGLAGAGAAAWLGARRGRAAPLLSGIGFAAVAMVALPLAASAAVFVGAQLLWALAFFFATPYLLGLAAALDPAGRWTAAAAGISTAGGALGPLTAGWLADSTGSLVGFVAASSVIAAVLVAFALAATAHDPTPHD